MLKMILVFLGFVPALALASFRVEDDVKPSSVVQPVAAVSAQALVVALVSGAASAPAAAASAVALEIRPARRWDVKTSDGTLSRALTRWADEVNVQLVWEAPKDKPALRAVYQGSLDDALTAVMGDTQFSDYQLHACAFDNVIRILHVSQSCKH